MEIHECGQWMSSSCQHGHILIVVSRSAFRNEQTCAKWGQFSMLSIGKSAKDGMQGWDKTLNHLHKDPEFYCH